MSDRTIRYCRVSASLLKAPPDQPHPYLSPFSEECDIVIQPEPCPLEEIFIQYGFLQDQRYSLIYDTHTPDMVITGNLMNGRWLKPLVDGIRLQMSQSFNSEPLLIGQSIEPTTAKSIADGLDYFFTSALDGRNNVCVGGSSGRGDANLTDVLYTMKHSNLESYTRENATLKTRFCNYIFSHRGETFRKEFCKKLMQYKHVDCPGGSLNNMPFPQSPFSSRRYVEKLYFIKDYKFTIAFENNFYRPYNYITEKIAHPLAVGSIPIYSGCEEIADYYNPKAFINCHDYPDLDAVIEHVKEVDNNPDLYAEYINAPPTLPGQHYPEDTLIAKFRRVADEIYAEVIRRRG